MCFLAQHPKQAVQAAFPLRSTCGVQSGQPPSSFSPSQGKAQELRSPCRALGFAPGGEEPGVPVVCTRDREKSPLAPPASYCLAWYPLGQKN